MSRALEHQLYFNMATLTFVLHSNPRHLLAFILINCLRLHALTCIYSKLYKLKLQLNDLIKRVLPGVHTVDRCSRRRRSWSDPQKRRILATRESKQRRRSRRLQFWQMRSAKQIKLTWTALFFTIQITKQLDRIQDSCWAIRGELWQKQKQDIKTLRLSREPSISWTGGYLK